jgi:hypothetical protein
MITKSKLVNIALAYSKSNVQDEMRKLFQSYQNGEIVELRNQVDFKYETFSMYTMALNTENNAYDELKVVNVSALDFIEIAAFFHSNYDFISEMLLSFRKKASFQKMFKAIEIDNVEIENRYIQMQELQLFITGISLYFLNNKNKNNAAI